MSELLIHFAVPFVAFSYFKGPKKAFLASLFALIPDIDALFSIHRSMTHSIIVGLVFFIPAAIIINRVKPDLLEFIIMATLAFSSHIILDLFTTYTPALWPLIGNSIYLRMDCRVTISNNIGVHLKPEITYSLTEFKYFSILDAPLFTSEGLIISVILVFSALLAHKLRSKP